MRAAIFYSGKFGSTRKYARWLKERLDWPVFDIRQEHPDPAGYDVLILGSSIIAMKPSITSWLRKNWPHIRNKQLLLFTVSGTEPGHPDLEKWIKKHLGQELLDRVRYVPLRGRLDLATLPWWLRLAMKLGATLEEDKDVKKRMARGFDYMDKSAIKPILGWAGEVTLKKVFNEKTISI